MKRKNNKMKKEIIIIVGGTGGHIYPGIALAQKILEKNPLSKIGFVVDKRPLAAKVISEKGYQSYSITSAPFPRKKFWQLIKFIVKIVKGLFESYFLLKKLKPKVLIAFGSYISVPPSLIAKVLGIPIILHEQNYFPGLANRFLTLFADKIAISYKESTQYFPPNKTCLTGNPIRKELLEVDKNIAFNRLKLEYDKITILIFGGSLGARSINFSFLGLLPYLEDFRESIQFVHICGESANFENLIAEYSKLRLTARVYKYYRKMEYAYSVADIIVARAGATTIAEISALGKPAILIPYPDATAQHQLLNAKPLCKSGGAIYYSDDILSGEGLAIRIIPLIKDSDKRKQMEEKLKISGDIVIKASENLSNLVMKYV